MKISVKKIIYTILLLSIAILAFYFFKKVSSGKRKSFANTTTSATQKEVYHCPMHPAVISDQPGKCPICHMDLVSEDHDHAHVDGSESVPAADNPAKETNAPKIIFYRNPMDAKITSAVPTKDNMGMDYIPVYDNEDSGKAQESGAVVGRGGFNLSSEKQQLIGVSTIEVKKQTLQQEIRATGRVAFDPELFTAIEEHRQALIGKKAIGENGFAGMKEEALSLVASSKTKLKLMGLTDEQIRKLSSTNSSAMSLLLPQGKVWVYAEVFEYEVVGIKAGQSIEAEAPSNAGIIFKGIISSISPVLNAPSRTVRVRAEVPDPKGLLRPDTYLNVRILKNSGEKLAIPEDAVLHADGKDFVFVQTENHFEPRAVSLGVKAGDFTEVVSGLKEGERVVTAANFLLDSESRLKAVLSDKIKSTERSQ